MEKEVDIEKNLKISVGLRQTSKGKWYVGSLRVDGDNVEEIDDLINSSMRVLNKRVEKLNNNEFDKKELVILLNSEEERLFNELKDLRRKIADKEGYPPYVVFHDVVLKRFAKVKPRTEWEMKKIDGVGEKNFEKYGLSFLSIIKAGSDVKIDWGASS